jgi:hypothetical protein
MGLTSPPARGSSRVRVMPAGPGDDDDDDETPIGDPDDDDDYDDGEEDDEDDTLWARTRAPVSPGAMR